MRKVSSHARTVLLVAAAIGLAAWWFWPWRTSGNQDVIRASGTVEATEVVVASKVPGRIQALHVDEGSVVRAGDPVADLDSSELAAQVDGARAALERATAQLQAARNGSRPEQIAAGRAALAQAQAAVSGARAALANARLDFARVTDLKAQVDAARSRLDAALAARTQAAAGLRLAREGTRADQVRQAQAAVRQAQVQVSLDERDTARMRALYEQGAISGQQWEASVAARDSSRAGLAQARARLADLEAGPRPEELRQSEMTVSQADANVAGARLALANAQTAYRDRLDARARRDNAESALAAATAAESAASAQLALLVAGTRPEDLRAAEQAASQAAAGLEYARRQLADAHVTAPLSGVVKTKAAEAGEVVAAGSPIVTIDDVDHLWLRVYVPENRYGRVRLGQPVSVTVDSFPGTTFAGTVAEIATDAEFTPKSVQTTEERVKLVYGVKVNLDNRSHRLKPGMPADATLKLR